jgi:hypothetical protein
MKISLSVIFICVFSINIQGQQFLGNEHALCSCKMNQLMNSMEFRRGTISPLTQLPKCTLHGVSNQAIPNGIYLFKRKRKYPKPNYSKPSSIIRF